MMTVHPALRPLAVLLLAIVLPGLCLGQAPSIAMQPANVSAVSGSNAVLTATATGAGPLAYQWRLFGANVRNATNATLTITNLNITNGGAYTVVITNSSGAVTSTPALLNVDEHLTFRILQLMTNGVQAVECGTATGDDRGGLVVSPSTVFITGDNSTVGFSAADLGGSNVLNRIYDSLCNNLRTEQIYVLANGTNIIANGGGTINALLEMDGVTGLPNGQRINLSTNITMSSGGIFSGYDRIVLTDGGNNVYDIALPSGRVTPRGTVPNLRRTSSESWVTWGLAEYLTNSLQLVYVENLSFPYTNIARIRVAVNSLSTPVAGFMETNALGDMANLAFSTSRSRWYFHYEGTGQFRSGDETIGAAKALFSTNGGVPFVFQHPQSQIAYPGDTVTLNIVALGNGPFSYQWRSNGVLIDASDSTTLVLSNVDFSTTSRYSVDVANAAGGVSSAAAFVSVIGAPQIITNPQTQSALPGTNASFQVSVLGAPPLSFRWVRNGTNVPGATNALYSIPFVTVADAGDYFVIVTNRYGSATSGVARLSLIVESAFSFKILGLSNDAVIVEHQQLTGNDYSGIAVSSNRVFVTGTAATAGFSAQDLMGGALVPSLLQALVTDLRTERIYSLGDGTNLFRTTTNTQVTTLIQINGTTGVITTNFIRLSSSVPMTTGGGVFSGYGQIVLHNGSRVYSIAVPSGVVADLGPMTNPSHQLTAGWAYWGLAENFGGSVYLAYVQNSTSIVRTRVPDGLTTSIANFLSLADMANISASVPRGRWYFHHEGVSQFGGTNQTVGFCSAAFSITPNPVVDHFSWESLPEAQFSGVPFAATITARSIDNAVLSNFSGTVTLAGFATADDAPVAVLPSASGNFSNGVWTGLLTVPEPVLGLVMRATDLAGRFGVSSPFVVTTTNDLGVQLLPSTNAATLYAALTYHAIVRNSGPEVSSAVFATNILPVNVDFISAALSQGGCVLNGGTVVCDLGAMNSGATATIDLVVVPNALGTLTNSIRVVRSAAESHPENNFTLSVIPVSMPAITFTDASVPEGDFPTARSTNIFTVELNTTSAVPVSVQYTTAPGTATNTGDYVTRSGLLVFQPGQTSTNIRVTIGSDVIYENDEYFFLNFFNVTNAALVRTQAVGTILNDDPQPSLVVSDVTVTEGNTGTPLVSFAVRLSVQAGVPISVNYATSNGTAFAGSDYNAAAGLLYYSNGATNLFVQMNLIADTVGESNEFFYVRFFNGTNINVNTQVVVVILNDDPLTVDHFSFSTISATQLLNMAFPVTITALDFSNNVMASYNSPVNLSGLGGAGEATVTVGSGTTTWFEPLYTFWHDSRTQVIYPPGDLRGVQRIKSLALNVTTLPGQALNNWTIRMKHTTRANFTGGGFEPTGWTVVYQGNVTVSALGWTTFNFTAPFDYNGVDNLMIDFSHNNTTFTSAGNVSATTAPTARSAYYYCDSCLGDPLLWSGTSPGFITSTIIPDIRLVTGGAALKITPTNTASFASGVWNGFITVLEPGEAVRLQAADAAQHAGASGSFTVLLADDLDLRVLPSANPVPTNQNLVYSVIVSNTGPTLATGVFLTNQLPSNATYVSSSTDRGSLSVSTGRIVGDIGSLASGEAASIQIAVLPNGAVSLTNIAVARRAEFEVYMANNTQTNVVAAVPLTLAVADTALVEGHTGTTNAVFAVSLSAVSTQAVSVAYSSGNSTALAGSDYQVVGGVLVFPPGVTNLSVSVPVFGDLLNEANEQFNVNLFNATNASIARTQAVGTIVNDDVLPMISISDVTMTEGRSGLTPATFTLTLSAPSGRTVFVNASTLDGTATSTDYVPTNAFIILPAGVTNVQLTVLVQGDTVLEPDEFFLLRLSGPSSATLAVAEARATILNDDNAGGTLDHFDWSLIPSPQTINRGISATVIARDGADALMPFAGTVSLRALAGTNALAIAPTNSAAFVNGIWSGTITIFGPATNVVLVADDGAGHNGASNPFDVNVTDLALAVSAAPQVLIASPFTYTIRVTNLGPATATGVTVTNPLPADAVFVSGNAPGGCAVAGGIVTCGAGVLSNGGVATITIIIEAARGGTLSNSFFVTAFEFDPVPTNNLQSINTVVTGDEDQDRLPDAWEIDHGLSPSNPNDANLDSDGDHHTNLQEYIASTDPMDAASVLRITAVVQAGSAQVRFTTILNRRYTVEHASAPNGPWATMGIEIVGDGDLAIFVDPEPINSAPRFYRVLVRR